MNRKAQTRSNVNTTILAVMVVLLFAASASAADSGQAEKGMVRVAGVDVAYDDLGEGIPVLMLHGFGVDRKTMKGCMEPVFSQSDGWRRIYFDLPGMGLTGPVESVENSDAVLGFVLEFTDRVLPGEKFLVVGESYGGYLAQGIVYKHPERVLGMLLICPMVVADDARRDLDPGVVIETDDSFLQQLDPSDRAMFGRFATVQNHQTWERFKTEMYSGMEAANFEYLSAIRRPSEAYSFSFDVERLPEKFSGPSLFLAGRQDSLTGYRDLWSIIENYPRSSFVLLDKAGHGLQIEQEALFNSLVVEWLERVPKVAPEPDVGVEQ